MYHDVQTTACSKMETKERLNVEPIDDGCLYRTGLFVVVTLNAPKHVLSGDLQVSLCFFYGTFVMK